METQETILQDYFNNIGSYFGVDAFREGDSVSSFSKYPNDDWVPDGIVLKVSDKEILVRWGDDSCGSWEEPFNLKYPVDNSEWSEFQQEKAKELVTKFAKDIELR